MDLSFLLDPPDRSVAGTLVIRALAPLSLVSAQPGSYYQSDTAPSDVMLYGLLENALGWHLGPSERRDALRNAQKLGRRLHGKTEWAASLWLTEKPAPAASGYLPLLRHHLVFDGLREVPPALGYDDLWARQAHRADDFWGGSRRYDARLEAVVTHLRQKTVKLASKSSATHADLESVERGVAEGDTVFQTALKPRFPYYYVSPTPRGYIVPRGEYRFGASATPAVARMIAVALDDPAAPLYLGSNDGWVDATWETP